MRRSRVHASLPSVGMAMMDVGVMGMGMPHRGMSVGMRVRFAGRIVRAVFVLVVGVVFMSMFVERFFMIVFMFVPLGQVQVDPDSH